MSIKLNGNWAYHRIEVLRWYEFADALKKWLAWGVSSPRSFGEQGYLSIATIAAQPYLIIFLLPRVSNLAVR